MPRIEPSQPGVTPPFTQPPAPQPIAQALPGVAGDIFLTNTVPVTPLAPGETPVAPRLEATPLTDEERALIVDGLLPAHFDQLKFMLKTQGMEAAKALSRGDQEGPFSQDYGNPESMVRAARRIRNSPELRRLVADTRKGDIILMAYNSDTDIIANATRGPFAHAVVCSSDGPPPEFIEAVGVTGDQNDPSCNKIRRSGTNEHFGTGTSYRRLRPTEGMPEPQRTAAVDAAVKFCQGQLGKPYDYTFGEDGVGRSFYCSSLAYYAYLRGANVPIQLDKAAQRDSLILALDSMLDALAPKDRLLLMDEIARTINTNPPPSQQKLVEFAVQRVLPACHVTAGLAETPEDKLRLQTAIAKFQSGQGMPLFTAATDAFNAKEQVGAFKTPVVGWFREQWSRLGIARAAFADINNAFEVTGLDRSDTLKVSHRFIKGFLPYSEALAGFLYGKEDKRTKMFGKLLDVSGWLKSHKPFSWVSGALPARGTNAIDGRFISPTDLAWAKMPHWDYNLRPGQNLDAGR